MPTYEYSSGRSDRFAAGRFTGTARLIVAFTCALFIGAPALAETPVVGANAPDFTLSTPTGKSVRMSAEQRGDALVLVVLRGFPGYQCPYCVRQVQDFIDHASGFAAKNTRVGAQIGRAHV